MLVKFRVKNFRSFRDDTEFSMVAANSIKEHEDTHVFQPEGFKYRLLKTAAIYGANASGKSNLLEAMDFMRMMVLTSAAKYEKPLIERDPFLLRDNPSSEPSEFELIFILGGREYRYGFTFNDERILSEWLYHTKEREHHLFKRNVEKGKFEISKVLSEGIDRKDFVRDNVLFLSLLSQLNGELSKQLVAWFSHFNKYDSEDIGLLPVLTIHLIQQNKSYKSIIQQLIRNADTEIRDFHIEEKEIEQENANALVKFFNDSKATMKETTIATHHTYFSPTDKQMKDVSFSLRKHESRGTRKLFCQAGPIIDTLYSGNTLSIDEFEASLHPLLVEQLLDLFNSYSTNPKNAQLIYTTQTPYLLDKRLQRRDQIWFVEKSNEGVSSLSSLSDYRVRNDAIFDKLYLQGRFGGIPYIDSLLPSEDNHDNES